MAVTEAAAHDTDSPIYSLTTNFRSFSRTPIIRIRYTFDTIIRPKTKYTIWPTIRFKQNMNRMFGTGLEEAKPNTAKANNTGTKGQKNKK